MSLFKFVGQQMKEVLLLQKCQTSNEIYKLNLF